MTISSSAFFDLWWYLSQSDWDEPNLIFLNHALEQSGWQGSVLTSANWKKYTRERIEALDWQEDVVRDVDAFVISSEWNNTMTKEKLLALLH